MISIKKKVRSFIRQRRLLFQIERNSRVIVRFLTRDAGVRTLDNYKNYQASCEYIYDCFKQYGYKPYYETFTVQGKKTSNVIAELKGTVCPDNILVVGAHYDTIADCVGADDNASGIAGLLEIARLMAAKKPKRTVRFAAFTLEEPPFFSSRQMGSCKHAERAKARSEKIDLMVCLDMIGFGSRFQMQNYPSREIAAKFPVFGNFITVASLPSSSQYVYLFRKIYNEHSRKKIYAMAAPASLYGIDHSDHYWFSKLGWPAVMLTDTAFYRNKKYHTCKDTYHTLNYSFLARNILGIYQTIKVLAHLSTLLPEPLAR